MINFSGKNYIDLLVNFVFSAVLRKSLFQISNELVSRPKKQVGRKKIDRKVDVIFPPNLFFVSRHWLIRKKKQTFTENRWKTTKFRNWRALVAQFCNLSREDMVFGWLEHRYLCTHSTTQLLHQGAETAGNTWPEESLSKKSVAQGPRFHSPERTSPFPSWSSDNDRFCTICQFWCLLCTLIIKEWQFILIVWL